MKMFQTRSESTGLGQWPTMAEALQAAKQDTTIWKISFTLPNSERIRLIRMPELDQWVYSPIEIN
jgi:hypothetical protein